MTINDDIIERIINFITPFNESLSILGGNKYSTINLVLLYYYRLRRHINIDDTDCSEMQTDDCKKKMAKRFLQELIKEYNEESSELKGCFPLNEKQQSRPKSKSKFEDLEDDENNFGAEKTELDRYLAFRSPDQKSDGEFHQLFIP